MQLLANTVVIQTGTGIHWEAVLITAVPALIAAIAAVLTALIARRNRAHLEAIDRSVNGVEPGTPTVREKVEALVAAVPGAAGAAEHIASQPGQAAGSYTTPPPEAAH